MRSALPGWGPSCVVFHSELSLPVTLQSPQTALNGLVLLFSSSSSFFLCLSLFLSFLSLFLPPSPPSFSFLSATRCGSLSDGLCRSKDPCLGPCAAGPAAVPGTRPAESACLLTCGGSTPPFPSLGPWLGPPSRTADGRRLQSRTLLPLG